MSFVSNFVSARHATQVGLYGLCFAGAILISGLLVAAVGSSPVDVLNALIDGSLRSPGAWGRTLVEMAPFTFVGLGVVIAFRAGHYNIGLEGQIAMGALAATAVALKVAGPAPMVIVLAFLGGSAAGGVWAGVAAVAYARRRVDVLISTLLLAFVAPNIVLFFVARSYLLLDTTPANTRRASQSERIADDLHLPQFEIFGNKMHIGVLIAVVLTAATVFLLTRTVWGLKIRLLGSNERAARRAGVRPGWIGGGALVLSGALAGAAGAMVLIGSAFRLQDQISNDYGWHGLLVALVARLNAAAILPVAFFFAVLRTGSGFLAATGISRTLTDVVQALMVIAALIPAAVFTISERRRQRRLARQAISPTT